MGLLRRYIERRRVLRLLSELDRALGLRTKTASPSRRRPLHGLGITAPGPGRARPTRD